mgnify:CR=1 FL=1
METLESLQRKLSGAKDLKSVVRTMKVVAALNIGQYEKAVLSLGDYYRTIALGMVIYLRQTKLDIINERVKQDENPDKTITAVVFGSDQGLVGQFNDSLADSVKQSLLAKNGHKQILAVGERVQLLLLDAGFSNTKLYNVPNAINTITPLVNQILTSCEEEQQNKKVNEVYIYHNKPKQGAIFEPVNQRLLPLDETWRQSFTGIPWPTNNIPKVAGSLTSTISTLVHSYLFTSLFKACAESLNSENACRLAAMQRAEKNIDELLEDLTHSFHSLRQSTIDAELFDVVSGFEAMKNEIS